MTETKEYETVTFMEKSIDNESSESQYTSSPLRSNIKQNLTPCPGITELCFTNETHLS